MSDRLPAPLPEAPARAGVERASATPARRAAKVASSTKRAPTATTAITKLRDLQVGMLEGIRGSEDDADAAAAMLLPGPRSSARERFQVYRSGYVGRLVDCLRDDYPVLAETLGDDTFEALGAAYVERHPSTRPNLNPFGRHMASFCGEARLEGFDPIRAFAAELAALEWALVEVLHAGATPGLDLEALASMPPEAWAGARFERAEAVRVLRFSHPVDAFYQVVRTGGGVPPIPSPAPSATAAYREGQTIWRLDLTPAMANLLEALFSGTPLGVALEAMGAGLTDAAEIAEAERNVMAWFREWVRAGFFARLVVS